MIRNPLTIKTQLVVCASLALCAIAAMYLSHLALTDIYHGEEDLRLEWRIVQTAFGVFFTSIVFTLWTVRRVWDLAPVPR